MKVTKFLILLICIVVGLSSCKKYGYDFDDGYDDASQNQGDGVLDSNVLDVDRSMYAKARVWPGLVGSTEPRLKDDQFVLDLNFSGQTAEKLRIRVAPRPLISTGYYAAPGELVKITVPAGIEGLIVQIGSHTGDRTGFYKQTRDPMVSMRQNLKSGDNYVRNLYGGTIYVEALFSYTNAVPFVISGAVKSPDFIYGQSTNEGWKEQIKNSSVPWLELRSSSVIFTVPRQWCVDFVNHFPNADIEGALARWNLIMFKYYNSWLGLSEDAANEADRVPQGPWRAILDVDFDAGGVAGYPFTANAGDLGGMSYRNGWFQSWINLDKINPAAAFGSLHELGHNVQQSRSWVWGEGANGGLTEVTNNLHAYYYAKDINFPFGQVHGTSISSMATALAYVKKPAGDPTKIFETALKSQDKIWMFIQLLEKTDWGLWTYIETEGRNTKRVPRSLQDRYDFLFEAVCNYTKINMVDYFNAWNLPVSQVSKNAIAAKGWPRLTKQIWLYDAINKTGGDQPLSFKFDYSRTNWSVISVSTEEAANKGTAAIDGNFDTFWYTKWTGGIEPPPHHITLDMKDLLDVKGFYFVMRQNHINGRPKNVEIVVSNNNSDWQTLGTFPLANLTTRQEVVLNQRVKFRYVRFNFKEPTNHAGGLHATMAEIGTFYDE